MGTDQIRNRKQQRIRKNDTNEMKRRDQVVVSRLRTGYSRATHVQIINHEPPPECPFCHTKITTDHILWNCKGTEPEKIGKGGKEEIEKLITYVKKSNCVKKKSKH
jgi:hypothetical protein